MNKIVVGKECRFAIHLPFAYGEPDLHMVKEIVHYDDGTTEPKVSLIENFKRPVWITKPAFRNHKEKKECEDIDKLHEVYCTQDKLRNTVAGLLDKSWSKDSLRDLCVSPYIYGAEVTTTSFIKKFYKDRCPNLNTPFTVAVFDTETNTESAEGEIMIATLAMGSDVFVVATEAFIGGITNSPDLIESAMTRYLGEVVEKRKIKLEYMVVHDEVALIQVIFKRLHELKPDLLAIWNMNFDIPKVISGLERASVDPLNVLCDPAVPYHRRVAKYKEGKTKRVTASGVVKPINIAERWHTLIASSSFYVIDQMCLYKQLRITQPNEPSYSLDSILKKHKKQGKLKFIEADAFSGIKWHKFMSTFYKIEYGVYNMYDCIGMQELDEELKEMSHTLPAFAGITDFDKFNSNPRKIADALFMFLLENGSVIGTAGPGKPILNMFEDDTANNYTDAEDEGEDEEGKDENMNTLDLTGWIIMLPSHAVVRKGIVIFSDGIPGTSNIHGYVFDSDCVSAYPSVTEVCNVSKATTIREVIEMRTIDEAVFRLQNINLVSGAVNAVEYCTTMFNLPTLEKLLEDFH